MTRPWLSVCICTARRAPELEKTLAALACADAPRAAWELLVVDNHPGDRATQAVLEASPGKLPLRVLQEPRPGLSHARNRAVASARGEILLFTDDDVSVDPGWLRVYDAATRAHPATTVFGGPIRPSFEGAHPAWTRAVERHTPTAYAWIDPPGEVLVAAEGEDAIVPFGANFAVRASVLPEAPFDPALGRRPGALLVGGEETHLLRRMLHGGRRGLWLRDAPVTHRIDRERMTTAYQKRYWHGIGYEQGLLHEVAAGQDAAAELAHLSARLAAARWRWRLRGWWRSEDARLPAMRRLARCEGRVAGYRARLAGQGPSA